VKSISGALTVLFASSAQFFKADLFTFNFIDGSVLRTTSADVALSFGGNTWLSESPIIERTYTTVQVGVTVDTMTLTVKPSLADTIGGLSWQAAARQGYLDGATVLVETAYLTTWPTVIGTLHVFGGNVSEVDPARTKVDLKVMSALELLNRPFPRNLYQATCLHTVYDSGCTVAKASFTVANTVAASPAPTVTSVKTGNAQPAGYFEQGVLTFTSGANNGLKRTVKSYDPATGFTFALPLPVAPSAADTISVFAGCDKTKATCQSKFSNIGRFRGAPFIPSPETVR
jgi:uncharacterized phage protein (TIGR02218 family)